MSTNALRRHESVLSSSQVNRGGIYQEVHDEKAQLNANNKLVFMEKNKEKNVDLVAKSLIGGMAAGGLIGGLCGIPGGPAGVGIGAAVGVGVGAIISQVASIIKIKVDQSKFLKSELSKQYKISLDQYLQDDEKYKELLKDKSRVEYNVMISKLLERDIPIFSQDEAKKEMVAELKEFKKELDSKLFKSYKTEQSRIEKSKQNFEITNRVYIEKMNELNMKYYPQD